MKHIITFILRLILSVLLAVIISWLFFKGIQPLKTAILAIIMLILAYLFEYTKKRDKIKNSKYQ
jgi:uncharacterized protein YacL